MNLSHLLIFGPRKGVVTEMEEILKILHNTEPEQPKTDLHMIRRVNSKDMLIIRKKLGCLAMFVSSQV